MMKILMVTAADSKGLTLAELLSRNHDVTVLHIGKIEIECPFKEIEMNERELASFPFHEFQLIVYLASDQLSCHWLTAVLLSIQKSSCVKCICIAENALDLSVESGEKSERFICKSFKDQLAGTLSFWRISPLYGDDFFPAELTETLVGSVKNNRIVLPGAQSHTFDVMYIADLAKAIECYAGEGIFKSEMNLTSGQHSTFNELGDAFHSAIRQANIDYSNQDFISMAKEAEEDTIKGWMPEHSFFSELPLVVRNIETEGVEILNIDRRHRRSVMLRFLSFLGLFILVCLYTGFIRTSSELQFVDVRLLFIVATSLFWGRRYGLAAAVLCSIASVAESIFSGTKWYVIFFHVDNWIPVAIYLASAVLLGMYRESRTSTAA